MSMTELERHLLSCLEGLQQEFNSSHKFQNNRLTTLEERQEEQEKELYRLKLLFKNLDTLLQRLSNALEKI